MVFQLKRTALTIKGDEGKATRHRFLLQAFLARIPKIKATRDASHGKKHTENTETKLFSVSSVCVFSWLK
jgi:hypothetical protein